MALKTKVFLLESSVFWSQLKEVGKVHTAKLWRLKFPISCQLHAAHVIEIIGSYHSALDIATRHYAVTQKSLPLQTGSHPSLQTPFGKNLDRTRHPNRW